jgi:hypothetical protein
MKERRRGGEEKVERGVVSSEMGAQNLPAFF